MRILLAALAAITFAVACSENPTDPEQVVVAPAANGSTQAQQVKSEAFFTGSVYRFDYFGAVLLGNQGGGLLSLHTPYIDGVYHWWPSLGACDGATEIRLGIQQRVYTKQGMLRLSKFDKYHVLVYRWTGEPITCEFLNDEYGNLVAEGTVSAVSVNHLDSSCAAGEIWNWNVGGNVSDVNTGQTLGYGAHRTHVRMPDCTWRENLSRKGPWLAGKGWSGNSAH